MIVVYIVGTGSHWQDNELRYSLRSVEKHLKGFRNIFIVGHISEWLKNVKVIPSSDISGGYEPERNVLNKLRVGCEFIDFEKFLFMNDDFFFLQDVGADQIPYFYEGSIEDWLAKRGLDRYGHCANNTLKQLQKNNLPTNNYELHYPIIFEKQKLLPIIPSSQSLTIRSLYANTYQVKGIQADDCKSDKPPLDGAAYYSTKPRVTDEVQKFLIERFPKKSKYEK